MTWTVISSSRVKDAESLAILDSRARGRDCHVVLRRRVHGEEREEGRGQKVGRRVGKRVGRREERKKERQDARSDH